MQLYFSDWTFFSKLNFDKLFPTEPYCDRYYMSNPFDLSTIHFADAQSHHTIIGLICYRAVFISRASPVFVWTFCAALIGFIDLPSERSGSQSSPSAQITERLWPSHWYFTNFHAPLWPKLSNQNHSCANTPLCVITQNVLIKKVWNIILEFKATLTDGTKTEVGVNLHT